MGKSSWEPAFQSRSISSRAAACTVRQPGASEGGATHPQQPEMQPRVPGLPCRSTHPDSMLVLAVCGLLQLPQKRGLAVGRSTPLLSALPCHDKAEAASLILSSQEALPQQARQEAIVLHQFAPPSLALSTGPQSSKEGQHSLEAWPVEDAVALTGPDGPQEGIGTGGWSSGQGDKGPLPGEEDEDGSLRAKTLLCTYCGQPRPCAAPCPLGVALAAIQARVLRLCPFLAICLRRTST